MVSDEGGPERGVTRETKQLGKNRKGKALITYSTLKTSD